MAQYVDVTNLPNFEVTCSNGEKYILLPYEHLSDIPTADVAPRAEVVNEIFDEVLKKLFEMQKRYEKVGHRGKAEQMMVAREEIFKLQKKFTEEKTDGSM